MKKIFSIIVFALLVGVANAQQTQSDDPEVAALKRQLEKEYQRKLVLVEYASKDSMITYRNDAVMLNKIISNLENQKEVLKAQHDVEILKIENARKVSSEISKGTGVIATIDNTWGTKAVLPEDQVFKLDSAKQMGTHITGMNEFAIEHANQKTVESAANVVTASNNTQIARQKTEQVEESLAQSEMQIGSNMNNLKSGIIPSATEAKGTKDYKKAVKLSGTLAKEQMETEIAKQDSTQYVTEKLATYTVRKTRRDGRKKGRQGIFMVNGVQVANGSRQSVDYNDPSFFDAYAEYASQQGQYLIDDATGYRICGTQWLNHYPQYAEQWYRAFKAHGPDQNSDGRVTGVERQTYDYPIINGTGGPMIMSSGRR